MSQDHRVDRRLFLGQTGCSLMSALPIWNTLKNLQLTGALAAEATRGQGNYRAIVCLFQGGGNDSFNLLTPYSGSSPTASSAYAEYSSSRSNLALALAQLHEITPLNTPGRTFGVHPSMPRLAQLFQSGDAAFVANVGTLVEPVQNRTQVALGTRQLPLGLYSHSDQIEQWQTSVPHRRSGIGWAGRLMDELRGLNSNQAVSMNISTEGSNIFQSGLTGAEYAIDAGNANDPASGGPVPLEGYSASPSPGDPIAQAIHQAVQRQLGLTYGNALQSTLQAKRRSWLEAYELYSAATAAPLPGNVTFPNTSLGRQLKQVAKAISGRNGLGAARHTFFVHRGGWDHHADTLLLQQDMLGEVDDALFAFWSQLIALGVQNDVVVFSASDFGRTLTSNGRGSDHAWGGNHFVLGGGVDGRKIFGQYPSLALNPDVGPEVNPLDTGRGRLIPTTSCDAYFAEMALWFGVPASSLATILPNIGNFYAPSSQSPVGFLP